MKKYYVRNFYPDMQAHIMNAHENWLNDFASDGFELVEVVPFNTALIHIFTKGEDNGV